MPSITLLSPSGGEKFGPKDKAIIEWAASDPDGDPLSFNVSYSPNPNAPPEEVRWLPIACGIRDTSVRWYLKYAPGADNGQIRITVSDGFNIRTVYSNPFEVAPKPPIVSIMQPVDGQVFQEYDSIPVEGMAFDLELGILDGPALQWSSDVDGPLGSGRRFILEPGKLSPKVHTIILSVTDGDSTLTESVSVTVLADYDRDGLADDFEKHFQSQDPENPCDAGMDFDLDGLTSLQEAFFGTHPEIEDTDGDGITDKQEITLGMNPLVYDNTPPVISTNVTGTLGDNGWYISDVTIIWEVSDEESKISSTSGCGTVTITTDTAETTFTCTAFSDGGSTSNSATIKRDATDPTITIHTPPNGASYLLSEAVISNYSCSDNLSGVHDCYGSVPNGFSINTAAVGLKNITVSSSDFAGNTTTLTHEYSVQYRFLGFIPPIRNDGSSIFKSGRTVPVKFQLTDVDDNFISDASTTCLHRWL